MRRLDPTTVRRYLGDRGDGEGKEEEEQRVCHPGEGESRPDLIGDSEEEGDEEKDEGRPPEVRIRGGFQHPVFRVAASATGGLLS